MAAATAWSPNTPPQPLNGRLDVRDQRGVLVAAGDELEEQVRGVLLEGQVADLVDDDQPVAPQPGELVGEPSGAVGLGEPGDPFGRGREQDPVAVVRRRDPESDREDASMSCQAVIGRLPVTAAAWVFMRRKTSRAMALLRQRLISRGDLPSACRRAA